MYSHVVDKVLEQLVPSIIEIIDIDGVVRRIDIDGALERIDINSLLQRVDWDAVIENIDWNKMMNRIDFDAIIERVDLDFIVAQSTAGVFTHSMDSLRIRLVEADLFLLVLTRHRCSPDDAFLPPTPGGRQRRDHVPIPSRRVDKSIMIQGRYCGFLSKCVATLIDVAIIVLSFSLIYIISTNLVEFYVSSYVMWRKYIFRQASTSYYDDGNEGDPERTILMIILYCSSSFLYFFLTVLLTSQTFGMAIVGIKVVDATSSRTELSVRKVFTRTLLLPVTIVILPIPLLIFGMFRRDGRMLHDLVAGTGDIFLWDAHIANLRSERMTHMEGYDAQISPTRVETESRRLSSFRLNPNASFRLNPTDSNNHE